MSMPIGTPVLLTPAVAFFPSVIRMTTPGSVHQGLRPLPLGRVGKGGEGGDERAYTVRGAVAIEGGEQPFEKTRKSL